jgi:uncharacterized protein (TIGR00369 family)
MSAPPSAFEELLERWRSGAAPPPPIVELLGIELVGFDRGTAHLRMPVRPDMRSAFGNLHGGVVCDLADVAMGVALATAVEPGATFATIELHCRFLRAVRAGVLSAQARVLHLGGRVAHLACSVHGEEVGHVAEVASSCAIRRPGGERA